MPMDDDGPTFDPTFDFRSDAKGRDPDTYSPTLRAYHMLLWSKPLPAGDLLELDDTRPGVYLYASCRGRDFYLSSDTSVPTWNEGWSQWKQRNDVVDRLPSQEREEFDTLTYQMGAMMLFPCNRIDSRWTLNQARGCTLKIIDRLDLTVECIRLFYAGEHGRGGNPLAGTLGRYQDFFDLFEDFAGYVDFFHLHDLVSDGGRVVRFFLPFDGFRPSPFPTNLDDYLSYRRKAIEFVAARNRRMASDVRVRVQGRGGLGNSPRRNSAGKSIRPTSAAKTGREWREAARVTLASPGP